MPGYEFYFVEVYEYINSLLPTANRESDSYISVKVTTGDVSMQLKTDWSKYPYQGFLIIAFVAKPVRCSEEYNLYTLRFWTLEIN